MSWEKIKLKHLLSQAIQNGYSPICPEEPNGKWVLSLGALTGMSLDSRMIKPAPPNDNRVDQFILRDGDFLVSRSVLFRGEVKNCSFPDLMMRFRVDELRVSRDYLEIYLRGAEAIKYFQRSAAGTSGSMVKINKKVLENLKVSLPPYPVQKKIAAFISTWDSAIEKTERLIEAKEKRLDWLQNIVIDENLNGWKKINLSEVSKIVLKNKLPSVGGETLLTVKLHCRGIAKNNNIKPKLTERGRPYFRRHANEFLIGRQNFHNGGFGVVPKELDGLIASNAITSLQVNTKKLDVDFLFYFFSRRNYYKKIGHIMDGTGQKELSDKQISRLILYLPSLHRQQKIAQLLNTAKEEILLLHELVASYCKQKSGLMQKLLTGQWMVRQGGSK